jgi:hypothetical protein
MKTLPLLLAAALLPALAAEPAPAAEAHDPSWRFPLLSIPRLARAPTTDGTVGDAEWQAATLLPAPVSMDPTRRNGLPPRERTWVWMGYTADALHMAWRQDLPPEELPVAPKATARDTCEGGDNTVIFWLGTREQNAEQFNLGGNASSQTYDRRVDNGQGVHWNPKLDYRSRVLPAGWEGELRLPFSELGLPGAPPDGARWAFVLFSSWRKSGTMLFAWPYAGWRARGEFATLRFGGNAPAIRFEADGTPRAEGAPADVQCRLLHRREKSPQSYLDQLSSALKVSQVEGGTFESLDKLVRDALAPFEEAKEVKAPGEYLLRYEVSANGQALARGVQPFYKAPPLELEATPFFLGPKKLVVGASAESDAARSAHASLEPGDLKAEAPFRARQARLEMPTDRLKEGRYLLAANALDAQGKVVGRVTQEIAKPEPPDWWTMKEGLEPRIPPPWTPVKAEARQAQVLGRRYEFQELALPSQVETRGQKILAGPMELRTSQPWKKSRLELASKDDESAVYRSESDAGHWKLKAQNRVEFDGFMLVDLELAGSGAVEQLDLVVPFRKEHAVLLQNYVKAPGPGDPLRGGGNLSNPKTPYQKGKRFVGAIPDEPLRTPPMLTTWIGTDHHGFEWSCESSRGWAMAKPNEAMEVRRDGERVVLTVRLVSKPIQLSPEQPRRIRFGLVATPTKTLLPHVARARFYDDFYPFLLPGQWGEHPVWHPPLKNKELIRKNLDWIEENHRAGVKVMINGGWNISTQAPEWETWGKEMIAEPVQNVSFHDAKQFASCWKTPFATFMANSFGYNARLLKFDGIRFDTVVPSYECASLDHDCGWRDDEGNLWPSSSIFSQREAWKRLYRIFHGGVIAEGCIQTPNAAGPIMAVHSFSDHHEIGEGYYMHAKTLKDGYPPDMIRANMTGEPYGFRAESNIKDAPLFWNQRIAAILVNGAEPRFEDYRGWKAGYEAHAKPAISIWNAFDWVDRWNSRFLGWWENGEFVKVADGGKMALASLWLQQGRRVLLVVANYEEEPLAGLDVKLDLKRAGLPSPVYAEDAVTLEPVPVAPDGTLRLDVLGQRYRLLKVSGEPPRYREEALGPSLLAGAPALVSNSWTSAEVRLEPSSTYVVTASLKVDQPIGAGGANPNVMGPFFHQVTHYASVSLAGEGIHGINATNKLARCAVKGTEGMLPYAATDQFKRSVAPQAWEKTPGWVPVFLPLGTGPNTASGRVEVRITDPGQAQFKDLAVRKLK